MLTRVGTAAGPTTAAPDIVASERALAFLVDASNLGGLLGGAAGARAADAVVRFLLPWARERARVRLVFDGPERCDVARQYGPLEVVWSRAEPADETIVRTVRAAPRAWVVITEDRELADRCRALGAKVEPASRLARRASARPRRPPKTARAAEAAAGKPPAHAQERTHWRKVFSSDEE